LAKVGGFPFIDWVRWEARLVEEGSEEKKENKVLTKY
jgi:hypothetical protein